VQSCGWDIEPCCLSSERQLQYRLRSGRGRGWGFLLATEEEEMAAMASAVLLIAHTCLLLDR